MFDGKGISGYFGVKHPLHNRDYDGFGIFQGLPAKITHLPRSMIGSCYQAVRVISTEAGPH